MQSYRSPATWTWSYERIGKTERAYSQSTLERAYHPRNAEKSTSKLAGTLHRIIYLHLLVSDKTLRVGSHIAESTTAMKNVPKRFSIGFDGGIYTSMRPRAQLKGGVLDMPTCGVVRDH